MQNDHSEHPVYWRDALSNDLYQSLTKEGYSLSNPSTFDCMCINSKSTKDRRTISGFAFDCVGDIFNDGDNKYILCQRCAATADFNDKEYDYADGGPICFVFSNKEIII